MDCNAILLRAHHGACIRYFRGEGYSESFARHMAEVIAELEPDTQVQIVCAPDIICAGCPNLSGGACGSQAKVLRYDRAVLKLCGIEENSVLSYAEFCELVETKVIAPGKRPEVCADCEWNDICF